MRRGFGPIAIVVAAQLAGCAAAAHKAGKEATQGALATLAGPNQGEGEKKPAPARAAGPGAAEAPVAAPPAVKNLGGGIAAGIVGKLAEPERLQDLEAVADRAGTALARSFARELSGQIGARGEGPLAAPLREAGQQVTAGAVRGLGIWPYLLAAAIGSVITLLAVAAVGAVGARRTSRRLEVRRTTA